jgi:hypothetical protein
MYVHVYQDVRTCIPRRKYVLKMYAHVSQNERKRVQKKKQEKGFVKERKICKNKRGEGKTSQETHLHSPLCKQSLLHLLLRLLRGIFGAKFLPNHRMVPAIITSIGVVVIVIAVVVANAGKQSGGGLECIIVALHDLSAGGLRLARHADTWGGDGRFDSLHKAVGVATVAG